MTELKNLRAFGIAGSGTYLPRRQVSASQLADLSGLPESAITRNFRITKRHWADAQETSSAMGALAAQDALAQAGWQAKDLDVLIGACGVMEQPIPGTSVLIQRRLGLGGSGIPAFDINATCLSFMVALDRVLAGFALGEWRRALIVSADIASAALDFSKPEASLLFGDGAAAIALEADGPHRRLSYRFASFGNGADACRLEAGGTRLRPHEDLTGFLAHSRFVMDGRAVFRATGQHFPDFLARLLADAGIPDTAIDLVIPHQASAAALEHLKRAIPDGHAKTLDIYGEIGNQIATSLPFALHHARQQGRTKPGETALMIGSAAGVSLGGAVIRW
jgi:3-oxoacyl-[acyl-carrier-protein] synthase-3